MQCFQCGSHPVLKRSKVSPPSFSITNKGCGACGTTVSTDKGFFYCASCKNYFLCSTCRVCADAHFLTKVTQLKNIDEGYEDNAYVCNICSQDKTVTDNGIWHCTPCTYDVCEDCLE